MAHPSAFACALIEPLFNGSTGTCYLGTLTDGAYAGRPALLRPMPERELRKIAQMVPQLELLACPFSTKLLGLADHAGSVFVASEYIGGTSLLELEDAARSFGRPLPVPVAIRVIRDALLAVHKIQLLLAEKGLGAARATLCAESIWLAEHGEVYLTELGVVAGLLASAPPRPGAPARGLESNPVRAAGVELSRLLVVDPARMGGAGARPPLPEPVSRLLEEALTSSRGRRFAGPASMAEALSTLAADLIANNDSLREEIAELLHEKLEKRKAVVERSQTSRCEPSDETRLFNLAEALSSAGITSDGAIAPSTPAPSLAAGKALKDADVTRHYDLGAMLAGLEKVTQRPPPMESAVPSEPTLPGGDSDPRSHGALHPSERPTAVPPPELQVAERARATLATPPTTEDGEPSLTQVFRYLEEGDSPRVVADARAALHQGTEGIADLAELGGPPRSGGGTAIGTTRPLLRALPRLKRAAVAATLFIMIALTLAILRYLGGSG